MWSSPGRPLLLAFVGIAVGFVSATAYTQWRLSRIDEAAAGIATNASPSIEQLAAARVELRRLQRAIENAPNDGPPVDDAYERFQAALSSYLALPTFAGEPLLRANMLRRRRQLDDLLTRGDRAEKGRAVENLDDALVALLDFNADRARDLAIGITRARRKGARVAAALDGASLLATLLAAVAVIRGVRRHNRELAAGRAEIQRRADELEQFAGRVAHDIMNPLQAAALALARAQRPPEPRAAAVVDRGQRSIERMAKLVRGLLAFARSGARPDPTARAAVAAVVDDVFGALLSSAHAAGANLSVDLASDAVVRCDPALLADALSNLVDNAIKHVASTGSPSIVIRARDEEAGVRLEVEDNGSGLPTGTDDSIFDPYVRKDRSGRGLGLGLATVKRIVEAYGGAVGFTSAPGRGSRFWLVLPRA